MSLLSTADLAYMQATQLEAMPGTVVIERYSPVSNGMGGQYETWAAIGTVVGRIYPQMTSNSQNESVGGAQVQSIMQWWATLPVGTDVTAKDRLLYNSRTWEVTATNSDEMYSTAVRCAVQSFNEERRA